MNKLPVLLSFSLCLILIPLTASASFEKTKIAVLDFQLQGEGFETKDMSKIVAEWLITALVKEGRFEVIERRLLRKVLEEQKLVMSGVVNEESATQLGKLLGVKVIISGSVMRFQNIMEVNARIIDVESASIITAESVKSSTAIRLEDLVVEMAEKIIKDFPLEGYIVQRHEESVTIDLGQRAGVRRGMRFIVFKEGNIVKHPRTGEILDVERIETGKIEISLVTEKIAQAKIISETSDQAIAYGQMVKSLVESVSPSGKRELRVATTKPSGVVAELAELDPLFEETRQLKEAGNPQWEAKYKEAAYKLKAIYKRNPTSAEVFLYYAKAFFIAENMRKVNKSLAKAIYYDSNYLDAYVMQGDMNYNYGVTIGGPKSRRYELDRIAREAYEVAAQKSQNKDLQAMMFFKIGNVYAELSENQQKAQENWQKAVSLAPSSEAGRQASAKLAGTNP
jgi:TolB-like protein